ncbi:MAG: cytochrome c peroxidase [Planctomycetota bacterium]
MGQLPSAVALLALVTSCGGAPDDQDESPPFVPPLSDDAWALARTMSPVPPTPVDPTNRVANDEDAAELGRHLFHSRALSKDGDVACATCHDPRDSFVDGRRLAEGVLPLERHTMSLWNVAHQRWFFWDGRSDSLWSQALVPLEDPLEHAFTRTGVARAVHADVELRRRYESVFGSLPSLDDDERFPAVARPVPANDRAHELAEEHARERAGGEAADHHEHLFGSGFYHPHQRAWDAMDERDRLAVTEVFVNVGKALAAFQGRIESRRSPFDVFVEGLREEDPAKVASLSAEQVAGFELFVGRAGCINCHGGPLFSDLEFHDTRVPVVDGAPADDPGRTRGIENLRASEFGVGSRWSDDPDGPMRVKVDYLPAVSHAHGAGEFKTPSLRNVALTSPYMHNGAFETLEEVVRFYATREGAREDSSSAERILRPLDLTEEDQRALVAFLESLTDDSLDLSLVRAPERGTR